MRDLSKTQSKYWRQALLDCDHLALKTDYPRSNKSTNRIESIEITLSENLSNRLAGIAIAHETKTSTILLSGLYVALAKLSDQTDILIGIPSDNVQIIQPEKENCFNFLPLRTEINSCLTIQAFINQVHQLGLTANKQKPLSFEQLEKSLKIKHKGAECPIFQTIFSLVDSIGKDCDGNLLDLSQHKPPSVTFDLNVIFNSEQSNIKGTINYVSPLFNKSTIERLAKIYKRILQKFANDTEQIIEDIDLLSEQERYLVLRDWNQTDADYPRDKTLHQMFEEQVIKTPDRIALVFEDQTSNANQITYRELNQRSSQLADEIRYDYFQNHNADIPADTLIVIYYDKTPEMLISIFAVLKAGAAYVPISTEYPETQIKFILSDTQSPLILSQQKYMETLTLWVKAIDSPPTIMVTDQPQATFKTVRTGFERCGGPADLAYVIYTSGTTGNPKGVLVEHQAVSSFTFNNRYINIATVNNVVSLSPYSFDGFVFDVFFTLLNGACVHLIDRQIILDSDLFGEHLAKHCIDSCFMTTALFNQLTVNGQLKSSKLRNLLFGGEKANLAVVQKALVEFEKVNLVHVYGPTETVVFASAHTFSGETENVPIGSPLNNKRFYVLNSAGKPVSIGMPGELFIGGAGLARGYLNRPELTNKSFLENAFSNDNDKRFGYSRLYKTGDVVRWLEDGNLEFISRNDRQIKLRGYRIELTEIESQLVQISGVNQAVVQLCYQQEAKFLAAYLVTENGEPLPKNELRNNLGAKLPEYMIPSTFDFLTSLPLTTNGKLDIKRLPKAKFLSDASYVAPRNGTEEILCSIWEALLGLDRVGVNDNFFGIGGNSITAIRLTAASRVKLDLDIPLSLLFTQKTIRNITKKLERSKVIISKCHSEQVSLSFAQERMLFVEKYERGTSIYHIPRLVKLQENVNLADLEAVFNFLINRHVILKTVYGIDNNGTPHQKTLDAKITVKKIKSSNEDEMLLNVSEEISRPFDLTSELAIRLVNYELEESQYLLILWHHIAFDGWSMDCFMHEFSILYQQHCKGLAKQLPDIGVSYVDYAHWQRHYLRGKRLEKLLAYWWQNLSGYESLSLPHDHPRPMELNYQGENIDFRLNAELSTRLREFAKDHETTLYTVLLSGFVVTLATLSGQSDVIVGTPSDNRQYAEVQSIIGFFVNSLVLRVEVKSSSLVNELINRVHGVVTQAQLHQELPFDKLVEELEVDRDISRHPIFQVMFSLQSFREIDRTPNLPFSSAELRQYIHSPALFDLSLFMNDAQCEIKGELNYALSLFERTTINRFRLMYQKVLYAFVNNCFQSIDQIDMLSTTDRYRLLHSWNQTAHYFSKEQTLQQSFEDQVKKTPENIALMFEASDQASEQITYQVLNNKANQLANLIRGSSEQVLHRPMEPETLIALYFDRSLNMLISLLAVLKAGGTYIPISTEYPSARTRFILNDAKPTLILTQQCYLKKLKQQLSGFENTPVMIAVDKLDLPADRWTNNLMPISGANDLAYIIYTSGTTGHPKGVMIEHRSVINLITSQSRKRKFGSNERVAWMAEYIFDASVVQLFLALTNGALLYIPSKFVILDTEFLKQRIAQLKITHLDATPSYLAVLGKLENVSYLKRVVCGGETCISELKYLWGHLLINEYGPTECTITAIECVDFCQQAKLNCIGKPIDNTRAYVLSETLKLVPVGAPGELHIAGEGVSRGYLNRPELTQEKFIRNPFVVENDSNVEYKRLYKTGDIVRWLPDGSLEYLGRKDNQTKIRGFRIELGEIESQLLQLDFVKYAVVLTHLDGSGEKHIVAYVVCSKKFTETTLDARLREYLQSELPDYMVPSVFMRIEKIPLTTTGKLDIRSLPAPVIADHSVYVAPGTDTQRSLHQIWTELLDIRSKMSIYANFFNLGGHSLLATKMAAQIILKFSVEVEIREIFLAMTIEKISQIIDSRIGKGELSDNQRVNVFHDDTAFDMEEFEL